jgi:hypothetical protein
MISLPNAISIVGMLVATFLGAWLGFLAAQKQDEKRQGRLHAALKGALLAEAETCITRTNSYLAENYIAAAIRLPVRVYEAAFAQLVATGLMAPHDVKAILDFYSQVQQVNGLLDQIQRHVQSHGGITPDGNVMRERNRLITSLLAKLREMNEPGTRFYDSIMKALGGEPDQYRMRQAQAPAANMVRSSNS